MLLALTWFTSPASAETTLRIGVSAFPVAEGNPFRDVILPRTLPGAAVFDTLTLMDEQGELTPWLAQSWHAIDEHTWSVQLRAGVEFSNGDALDAAGVVAVLNYIKSDEAIKYSITRDLEGIAGARVTGPLTFEIRTHRPDAMLMRALSGLRIPAAGPWRSLGPEAFSRQPVGTGPFQVVAWTPTRIELAAVASSWRRPRLDRVQVLLIPEQAARTAALLSGAIDVAMGVGPDDVMRIRAAGGQVLAQLGGRLLTLAFVTVKESPLTDPRVRQALNYAVNRKLIVASILAGATEPATQTIPRRAFGYDPTLEAYPYDPQRARQLLGEAGYADGFKMVASVSVGAGSGDEAFYQAVAADLRSVGVDMQLNRITVAQLVQYIYEGGWPGLAFGMDYGTEPSLDGLRPFFLHSCLWMSPWHCDPRMVPLIEAARSEFDLDKRRRLVQQIVRQHHAAPPGIMLWELPRFDAVAATVRGYRTNLAFVPLEDVSVEE